MEKANEEKRKKVFIRTLVESAEKQIIKNHMKNKEKHSCSISPELRSPAKSPSPSREIFIIKKLFFKFFEDFIIT